ncbi:MAG TPA: hypothetical protein G4O07_00060 [Dehalococcoidia bacterium]|nr:hypothetical protein [Dehalococcoidia bacterium]
MVELSDKVTELEDEIKVLKNEIQAVLLDLRESYLNLENPVSRELPALPEQHIIVSTPQQQSAPKQSGSHQSRDTNGLSVNSPEEGLENNEGLSTASKPLSSPGPARDESPSVAKEQLYEPEPTNGHQSVQELKPRPEFHPAAAPGPAAEIGAKPEPGPAGKPEPASGPETVVAEEAAHEEVRRAWRPMAELEFDTKPGGNGDHSGQIDLATIINLADWVAEVVERLGSERAQSILDISEMVGFIDTDLKNVLTRFIHPTPGEKEGKVTTRDYLTSLKELDSILGKATKFEIALLSILCQGNDSG